MSAYTFVQYWANWLTHHCEPVYKHRIRKRMALSTEVTPTQDLALVVQVVTVKSGYPMGSTILPWAFIVKASYTDFTGRMQRLFAGTRLRVLKPEEYAILREDPHMMETWPTLWWYLTADFNNAGKPRVRARLNCWVEGQRWVGFVRDLNTRLLLWGAGDTHDMLLDVLEARLAAGSPLLWRTDKFLTGKSGRQNGRTS